MALALNFNEKFNVNNFPLIVSKIELVLMLKKLGIDFKGKYEDRFQISKNIADSLVSLLKSNRDSLIELNLEGKMCEIS